MNDAAKNIVSMPSHAGQGKLSVINPSKDSKRPRPIVKEASVTDLDWDPCALEQFTFPADGDGRDVRAGDSFAICRPGMERWPLGHASDVYRPTPHRHTVKMVTEACVDMVKPMGAVMSGHGYRVAHNFSILNQDTVNLHGLPVTSQLTVVHDHTALHALRARMLVFVGKDCLGSFVGARAIHVAANPEKWRVEVEAMVAKSMKAQDALLAVLRAADTHVLTEADKALLVTLKVNPPAGVFAGTLLDSCVAYFRGKNSELTWGVYERRLSDDAIRAMIVILGAKKFGVPMDLALGGKRYGHKFTDEARKNGATSSSLLSEA